MSLTLSFARLVQGTGVGGTFFKGQSCLLINLRSHIYLKGNSSNFNFSLFLNSHIPFFTILVLYIGGVLWKFKESKKNSLIVTQSESAGKQRVFCGQNEWEGKERQASL